MRFLVHALMVFFATLAVAALVALGEPGDGGTAPLPATSGQQARPAH